MKLRGRELKSRMKGEDVVLLQKELLQLGYVIEDEERSHEYFGQTTRQAVLELQGVHGLSATGIVDERTAKAINDRLQTISTVIKAAYYIVQGYVQDQNKKPIQNIIIRAVARDRHEENRLGETRTDESGRYKIEYSGKQFSTMTDEEGAPNLIVRAYDATGAILANSREITKPDRNETIDLEIKSSPEHDENKKAYKVSGQVFNSNAEPIVGQSVLAVDVDLRGAAVYKTVSTLRELRANQGFEILGTAQTNDDGYFEISFTEDSYKRNEIGLADVVVFAVDESKIIARSKLATQKDYTNDELAHWDIQLPDAMKRGISEFARLMAVIGPFVKQSGLQLYQLSGSDDQVSFLATETNQDQMHTSLAVQSDKLRSDYPRYEFSSELFYGIGRQNITLSWVALLQEKEDDLKAAVRQSIDQNIISPRVMEMVDVFTKNVMDASLQHSTTAPETAPLYKTMGFSITDPELQKTFAQTYLQFTGKPIDFWNSLAQKPGFTHDIIKSLQLTNQLSILTGQHAALIEELQVNKEIKTPADLLSLSNNDWYSIINKTGVPDSVTGNTPEEKAANYINGMQNLLNAAYPTEKIALMVNSNQLHFDDANVKEKVAAFFAAAQNTDVKFNISTSRIIDFDKTIQQVAGDWHDQVLQHLQLIQRIYQVSPTPDVMNTLITKGYTSAYHISAISQNAFIAMESESLGGSDVAFSVYNRARHQVMRAQHTVLKVRDTLDRATPSRIISRDQQHAISDYMNNLNKARS